MATHPALRGMYTRTMAYSKASMSGVCSQCNKSCGVSYLCNRCAGWVHSKCSGLQNSADYRRIKDWVCSSFSAPPHPLHRNHNSYHNQFQHRLSWEFIHHHAILNANGIGNKLPELGKFLERHNVKVAVLQEGIKALL